jgi:hypothetical protein
MIMIFFFESGKGHAITTYNTEYSHMNTGVAKPNDTVKNVISPRGETRTGSFFVGL